MHLSVRNLLSIAFAIVILFGGFATTVHVHKRGSSCCAQNHLIEYDKQDSTAPCGCSVDHHGQSRNSHEPHDVPFTPCDDHENCPLCQFSVEVANLSLPEVNFFRQVAFATSDVEPVEKNCKAPRIYLARGPPTFLSFK